MKMKSQEKFSVLRNIFKGATTTMTTSNKQHSDMAAEARRAYYKRWRAARYPAFTSGDAIWSTSMLSSSNSAPCKAGGQFNEAE